MRNYDYMHSGLTDGLSATAGNTYNIQATDKLIGGRTDGWRATDTTIEYKGKTFRWFVNEDGTLLAFDSSDIFKQYWN